MLLAERKATTALNRCQRNQRGLPRLTYVAPQRRRRVLPLEKRNLLRSTILFALSGLLSLGGIRAAAACLRAVMIPDQLSTSAEMRAQLRAEFASLGKFHVAWLDHVTAA
jgi:hypothetical protein